MGDGLWDYEDDVVVCEDVPDQAVDILSSQDDEPPAKRRRGRLPKQHASPPRRKVGQAVISEQAIYDVKSTYMFVYVILVGRVFRCLGVGSGHGHDAEYS